MHISNQIDLKGSGNLIVLLLSSCAERGDTEEQFAHREGHTNWREGSQTVRASQTARGEAHHATIGIVSICISNLRI